MSIVHLSIYLTVTVQDEDELEPDDESDYDKVLLAGLSDQMMIVWAVDNVESDAIDPGTQRIEFRNDINYEA